MSTQAIIDRLHKVQGKNGKYRAQCPAHGSKGLTLSVKECDDGSTLMYCFAGCTAEDVMGAIGLPMTEMFNDKPYVKPEYTKKDMNDWLYDELFYEIYKADVKKGIKPTAEETAKFKAISERKYRGARHG